MSIDDFPLGEYKKCKDCKKDLPFSGYYKNSTYKDGYVSTCIVCTKLRDKISRERCKVVFEEMPEEHKGTVREQKREYKAEYDKRNKDRIQKYCKEYRVKNIERLTEYNKQDHIKNKERNNIKTRKHYQENKLEICARRRQEFKDNKNGCQTRRKERAIEYRKNNKDSFNARTAKRRVTKKQAMPVWLSEEHLIEIKEIYRDAQDLQWLSDDPLEVDHIIPIQGNTVCGLHVPWNLQILTRSENRSKSNKLEGNISCQ